MDRLLSFRTPLVVKFKGARDKIVAADRVATGALHRRSMLALEVVALVLALGCVAIIGALVAMGVSP